MTKGPEHKQMVTEQKVKDAFDKKHPEPMFLFQRRVESGAVPKELPPKYRRMVTLGDLDKVHEAVKAWDNSDPFAADRAVLHAKQGFIEVGETVKELHLRTLARKAARTREVDLMRATI